jgi:hypothetical protein
MASRAAKAAEQIQKDKEKREAGSRTTPTGETLTAVKDKNPDQPMTVGDKARAEVVAQLPAWQQAEYARLVEGGTRHVTALAAAKKVPDPATTAAPDVDAAAANLFAAFAGTAGQGAAAPPVTVPAATGKPAPDSPPAPPQPKPAQPKAKAAPKPPKPAPAPRPAPDPGSCDRWIGTVTATGLDGQEHVYDCEHGARNGHQTVEAAENCGRKLLRNHPTGTPGTRLHPVKRDRNGAKVPA